MVVLRWKNNNCTEAGLNLIQAAAKRVEDKLHKMESSEKVHVPTLLNDEIYQSCVAVAVSHNSGQGSSFRGLECAQFEINSQVYNIAIIRK